MSQNFLNYNFMGIFWDHPMSIFTDGSKRDASTGWGISMPFRLLS